MEKALSINDPKEMEALAEKIGARLRGGEVIELVSDLGGGKTTFTRGLVRGAGSSDVVSSPTFTVSKVYKSNSFEIHHFDFYRLADAGLAAHELADLLHDPAVVVVTEWSGVVEHILPNERVTISIMRKSDTTRELRITYPNTFKYLLEEL